MGSYSTSPHVSSRSLRQNVNAAFLADYPLTSSGYFGSKGDGGHETRNIYTDDVIKTSKDFYDRISQGGKERKIKPGVVTLLSDGTEITYRVITSSKGSPAVTINIKKSNDAGIIKYQKIHFKEKDQK